MPKSARRSQQEDDYRRQKGLIDTSQKGDWDNMRNEKLDGKPYDFNEEDVNSGGLPSSGTLEFDYVSTNAKFRQAANAYVSRSVISLHCLFFSHSH